MYKTATPVTHPDHLYGIMCAVPRLYAISVTSIIAIIDSSLIDGSHVDINCVNLYHRACKTILQVIVRAT